MPVTAMYPDSSSPLSHDYLSINAGSSSIKFALYRQEGADGALVCLLDGGISGIGSTDACFSVHLAPANAAHNVERHFPIPERVTAVNVLVEWLSEHIDKASLYAVAHRVVHGAVAQPTAERVHPALLATLYDAVTGEPEHLPQQIHLIDLLQRHFPAAAHIACFDSAFHAGMAPEAAMLPVPHRYYSAGVRRFGYHGLSCSWMMHELAQLAGPQAASGKVVLAHLGGGASITAVDQGIGRDTSMGLTPAGGISMGKRSGDLDPGLAWHCARHEAMTPAGFNHMVNHESGMLGVSGRSADLRVLLEHEEGDSRCADAVALFLYQARKTIWAMAGAIDGMETLVFSGGIGENAAVVRARICAGLAHLGVQLDADRNALHASVISAADSAVTVRVIRSDEQWMLAHLASQLLATAGADHA